MRTSLILLAVSATALVAACTSASDSTASADSNLTLPTLPGLPGLPGLDGGLPGLPGSGGGSTVHLDEVTGFGSNPGGLRMFEHTPTDLPASPALLVVLHGCSQNAPTIASAGFNDLADARKFVAVYPQQSSSNNPASCFNWFNADDQTRGQDENESVKEMVDKAIATHGIDPARVFVAGFSAGAAQSLIMAATWPDVFAGAASLAGIPFGCAKSQTDTFTCQNPGKDYTPDQWAALVKQAVPSFSGRYPRISVWQGTKDSVVGTKNRGEIVDQWTGVHGVSATPVTTETVAGATHTVYGDDGIVESWSIPGMDHDVPVVPSASCGTTAQYAVDKGVCAAGKIADFFGL